MTADAVEEDGSEAAALAFETLRAEVADLRRCVEAIGPALREARGPDYSPTLGALAASLEGMASRLELIERHTGTTMPAEVARREIARVYDASLRPACGDLDRATREVEDAARSLAATVGQARSRREQRAWVLRTAVLAAMAGFVAFPLLAFPLARALPMGDVPDRLAAAALGVERWTAGEGLMSRSAPNRWSELVAGYMVARAAGDDLKVCLDAAQKAGREQRCWVTVRPASAW